MGRPSLASLDNRQVADWRSISPGRPMGTTASPRSINGRLL